MSDSFRLPNDTDRIAIIGRTGSGKTQAALWHLSNASIDRMPWVILDFKGDSGINRIRRARYIGFDELPETPGVYILQPRRGDEEAVDEYLDAVRERGEMGIYVDEGYMLGRMPGFETLLMQGRSKFVPMIVLTQRPAWISRFVFSESNYYQVFHLNSKRDKAAVEEFVPADLEANLPAYHSRYYDVGENRLIKLRPVPKLHAILAAIDRRIPAKQKFYL